MRKNTKESAFSGGRGSAPVGHGRPGSERPTSEKGFRSHEAVAALDPLGAVSLLVAVPRLNRQADVDGLLRILQICLTTVPGPSDRERENSFERSSGEDRRSPRSAPQGFGAAAAAMRDVGIVLGSLRRHGVEPLELWPELEPWLLEVGRRTDLPPRDTLLHYTVWNPPSDLRTYTELAEERRLIEAVRMAYPPLEEAVFELAGLAAIPLDAPDFERSAQRVAGHLRKVRDAAVHTYRFVDRRVFVESIRPYFEPIRVDGKDYLGPGAVAMPLFILDHVLWSASVREASYVGFKQDYLPVTLPELRRVYDRFSAEGPLLDRLVPVLRSRDRTGEVTRQLRRNVAALDHIFVLLQRFRAVHLRMARQAYRGTVQGERRFHKGSGGYAPDMLEHIDRLTARARARLAPWLSPSTRRRP